MESSQRHWLIALSARDSGKSANGRRFGAGVRHPSRENSFTAIPQRVAVRPPVEQQELLQSEVSIGVTDWPRVGMPTMLEASKEWATVAAFGTKHTFDMVAKARAETLAVEIKLVDARRSRMPNGDIQRFLGQCALAAVTHDVVIGLCGYRGSLEKHKNHSDEVQDWNKKRNIRLVFVKVS